MIDVSGVLRNELITVPLRVSKLYPYSHLQTSQIDKVKERLVSKHDASALRTRVPRCASYR